MTILNSHRRSGALVAAVLAASGIVFAASPAAASHSTLQATTTTCGVASISKHTAPAVGQSATYAVHLAGSVTVRHESLTTLKVTSVKPASGWVDVVVTASGTKVHVGFQQVGAPVEQERFWARINSTGTIITTVLQTCT